MATALMWAGLMTVHFAIQGDTGYVLEVNPARFAQPYLLSYPGDYLRAVCKDRGALHCRQSLAHRSWQRSGGQPIYSGPRSRISVY